MTVILAIDAAWTATEPAGVALVASDGIGWELVAVTPNYDSFLLLAEGTPVDWSQQSRFAGSVPDVPNLLQAAKRLAGSPVDLVTIDMPIATVPITSRREADNEISIVFGGRGCSTHTPSAVRPGQLGAEITEAFGREGFPVATTGTTTFRIPHLIEVYPHPALLALLGRPYRVPYKAGKSRRYWPNHNLEGRIGQLYAEYSVIHAALSNVFSGLEEFPIGLAANVSTLSTLKRYEDAIDALVCAYVGVSCVEGSATAYGDKTAAIWCPTDA